MLEIIGSPFQQHRSYFEPQGPRNSGQPTAETVPKETTDHADVALSLARLSTASVSPCSFAVAMLGYAIFFNFVSRRYGFAYDRGPIIVHVRSR